MDLHLTDEQAERLLAELDRIIEGDRYAVAASHGAARDPRIRALLKPYPERPPPQYFAPPSKGRYSRRH